MPRDRFESMEKYPSPTKNFLFPSRVGRSEFFLRNMGLSAFISLPLAFLGDFISRTQSMPLALVYICLTIAATAFAFWFTLIPRMRDLGWHPAFSLLMFVPGVNFAVGLLLLFTPGR